MYAENKYGHCVLSHLMKLITKFVLIVSENIDMCYDCFSKRDDSYKD